MSQNQVELGLSCSSFVFDEFYNGLYNILIKKEGDISEYVECLKENKNPQMALLELRKRKVIENELEFLEFDHLFNNDKKKALEKLFLQPVENKHINYIKDNKVSSKKIYNQYQTNKTLFLERILKKC